MIYSVKKKAKKYVTSLPTMSILKFILSDANFYLWKVNYCKIRNSIIKNYYHLIEDAF